MFELTPLYLAIARVSYDPYEGVVVLALRYKRAQEWWLSV